MNAEELKQPTEICPEEDAAKKQLSRKKADMLILTDIVTEKSRAVELIEKDALFELFRDRAADAPLPDEDELYEEADRAVDDALNRKKGTLSFVPPKTKSKAEREENAAKLATTRRQREVFTRREMLRSLLSGDMSIAEKAVAAQKAAEEAEAAGLPPAESREITLEYFEEVLADTLNADCGVASLEAWDGKVYYHYRPLLSASYARILSAKGNPMEMLCDLVRESSRIYPRPVSVGTFQMDPFNFTTEELQEILKTIPDDPSRSDIRFTQSSVGTVYLYSTKYLEDDYADFLAEEYDVGMVMNP